MLTQKGLNGVGAFTLFLQLSVNFLAFLRLMVIFLP